MNKHPNKYFIKILLFGIIISSFPVITIGIFSYFKASSTIQTNANQAKEMSLNQIQNSVEQVLKTTDHSLTYFVNSALLINTLSEPLVVHQFQLFNEIRQELTHLQTFDTGISDIVLLSKEKNWFINNIGLYRLEQVEDAVELHTYFHLPVDSMWRVAKNTSDPKMYHTCQTHIELIKKLPLNSTNKKGLAITKIPVCHLGKLFSYDQDNESVMIVGRDQQVFLHTNPTILSELDIRGSVLDHISTLVSSSGQFRVAEGVTNFTVSYRKSDYNGWTYLSFISIEELTKQSRAIGWFTAGISIALLIVALIVAWFVSQRIYSPVKKLFNFTTNVFPIRTDKPIKDGFEFLTEQIHHVVDENSQMENKLQTQAEQLKVLFMLKLYQGDLSSKDITEKLHSYGYNDSWHKLSVITVQIDTLDGTRYNSNDQDLLLFAINNIMEELITDTQRLTPIVIDQSQTTIRFSHTQDAQSFKEDLFLLAQNIQQTISKYLQLDVSIGISLPFTELVNVQQAYHESLEALKNRMRLGDRAIIYYHELPQGGYPIHTFFPSKLQNELSDAIKVANREQVDHFLALFFQDLLNKQLGPKEYEMWTARLLIDFIQLTHSLGIHYMSFTDNQSVFEQMFRLRTTKEIQDWLRYSIIEPIIVTIEERMLSQYKKISEHIIMIIQEEFEQEISLDSIASRLHYNPNYISSVFRKETGIPFSEYLAMHRHVKAVHYLKDTGMSIKEISQRLQYNNSQNFIRSFRKTEGMTPGQYREQHKHQ